MTVSAPEHRRTLSETEIDRLIHAGAEMGMGWEDIRKDFRVLGIEADDELIKTIVLKRTAPAPGAARAGARGMQR
jgi:hypothetical protein